MRRTPIVNVCPAAYTARTLNRQPLLAALLVLAALLAVLLYPRAAAADSEWQCDTDKLGTMRCTAAEPVLPRTGAGSGNALDWQSGAASDEATQQNGGHCPGSFVQPQLSGAEAKIRPDDAPLRASADNAEIRMDDTHARLSGNVGLQQGYRNIRADQLDYYRDEDRVELVGNIELREPGLLLRGDRAEINPQTGKAQLEEASFVLHDIHAHGSAKKINRSSSGIIRIRDGSYTNCPPGKKDWDLRAKKIRVNSEAGRGVARNAHLRVANVPVLYTPYFQFPTDSRRLTGLLFPSFGGTAESGVDISIPYYINVAPNYDLTLIPRLVGDRGTMVSAEGRYLNHWSESVLAASFLPDDDESGEDRWLTRAIHDGEFIKNLRTHIDYTKVSDDDYFKDLSNGGLQVRRMAQLDQQFRVDYRIKTWNLQARVEEFQTLDDDLQEPYRILPRIELVRGFQHDPFKLDYQLLTQYTRFDDPKNQFQTGLGSCSGDGIDAVVCDRVTGQRLYLEPGIRYPMKWAAGFLVPTLKYRQLAYTTDDQDAKLDDSPALGSAVFSVDAGMFFERESTAFGKGLVHTLEPRLYYLWADKKDHRDVPDFDTANLTFSFSQLFRDTRFSGYDRLADANQLSAALTTRFLDANEGIERVSASIGQIRYFEDREVVVFDLQPDTDSTSKSQIASEVAYRPSRHTRIRGSMLWDPHQEQIDEGGVQYHWANDGLLFNLGYRYRRQAPVLLGGRLVDNDVDQGDISGVFPVNNRWKLFARYQYDFTEEQNIEQMVGVEYNSCCWAFRLLYQEGLDREGRSDEGIFFEFVLFGLGGIGDSIDNVLRKSIHEYDTPEADYGR